MSSKSYREKILGVTKGVLSTLSDYLLIQLYFGAEVMTSGYGSHRVYQASERAWEDFFDSKGGSKVVRQNFYKLRSRGLLSPTSDGNQAITKAGWKRIKAAIPFYDERRAWDGKVYLVTFDIPEERKSQREFLRNYLKKIGCGMLQLSVWVTPYDPRAILRSFVERAGLEGLVLVADVGKDGSIAGESIPGLMQRVFKLGELDSRYRDFVDKHGPGRGKDPQELRFDFLSILGDDPQLPFSLLPKGWLGEKAYTIYQNSLRPQS